MTMFRGLRRKHFAVIAADPGTKFQTRSKKGITARSPEQKYTTLTDRQIAALPVRAHAARNAFLFYWDTGPRIAVGRHIPIMRAWGFEPVAMAFFWIKTKRDAIMWQLDSVESFQFGPGYTTRKNAEWCILGRRGNPPRMSRSVRELIISQRREHSRKPEEFFARVMDFSKGPYLELFSRTKRKGWTCRGDQVGTFKRAA